MSFNVDKTMLSFVPYKEINQTGTDFKNKMYYFDDGVFSVTNELEDQYAELQNYLWKNQLGNDEIMEQLCTPYVKLTQEMLGNSSENAINFVPGSVFYLTDFMVRKFNLSKPIEIRVTNDGLEAWYEKEYLSSSTYIGEQFRENVHYFDCAEAERTGKINKELREKVGSEIVGYSDVLEVLLSSIDKIIRVANGQLSIDKLDSTDEERFQNFIKETGIQLDYTKEFSINGQKMTFNRISIDSDIAYDAYTKMEYVGVPRDASSLEFLSELNRIWENATPVDVNTISPAYLLNRLLSENATPSSGRTISYIEQMENLDNVDIWKLIKEQWAKYISDSENIATELLLDQLEMRNWSQFFEDRAKAYREAKDEKNENECTRIAKYLEMQEYNTKVI